MMFSIPRNTYRKPARRINGTIVGGLAANAHGAIRTTSDLDIVYARSAGNLEKLARALAPISPYLRGAPPNLPFRLDVPTLKAELNFTLSTCAGDLDLLGAVAGGGDYQDLLPHSRSLQLFGVECMCLDLDTLRREGRLEHAAHRLGGECPVPRPLAAVLLADTGGGGENGPARLEDAVQGARRAGQVEDVL